MGLHTFPDLDQHGWVDIAAHNRVRGRGAGVGVLCNDGRACDADADGAFSGTVTDAVYLLNFNFLGGPPPAAPFPQCAASSLESDAALGCEAAPAACP